MSERNLGRVVPFALPASRIRRGAEERRKRGEAVKALELLRSAARQEDSAAGWLHLARQLRREGCSEQAADVLYRLCAREEFPPAVWLELARCLADMGRRDAQCDCIYHYLELDPYSDEADAAREMLAGSPEHPRPGEPFRLDGLVRRGVEACRRGEQALGERRIRRAIRMSAEPAPLYVTLAVLELSGGSAGAVRSLNRALKREPGNIRALTMRCVALSARGARRAALGLLRACAPLADTPQGEEHFLAAAWAIGAPLTARRYLEDRLKLHPCRTALMRPLAEILWQQGEEDMALRWWQKILAVDPDCAPVRAMVEWAREHPGEPLPAPEVFSAQLVSRAWRGLVRLAESADRPDERLRPGSAQRATVELCFSLPSEHLQHAALHMLARQDTPRVRAFLRELLVTPSVLDSVRNKAMIRLAEMGDTGPMNVLMAHRVTLARLSPVKRDARSLWRIFLPRLLREAAPCGDTAGLCFFAAQVWRTMPLPLREEATGRDGFIWARALAILYLYKTGAEEEARRLRLEAGISRRRIKRILHTLVQLTEGVNS